MKDVEIFYLFEYRDICFNLEEKGQAFYDLALSITLCNISTCLNTQTTGKILN